MRSAVLDTNVIVSGLLKSVGPPAAVLDLGFAKQFRWYISEPIWTEYGAVLARKRLRINPRRTAEFLADLRDVAAFVTPARKLRECTDANDNKFLECALEARADFVVTGNARHYPSQFQDIRVIPPRQFLTILAAEPR